MNNETECELFVLEEDKNETQTQIYYTFGILINLQTTISGCGAVLASSVIIEQPNVHSSSLAQSPLLKNNPSVTRITPSTHT